MYNVKNRKIVFSLEVDRHCAYCSLLAAVLNVSVMVPAAPVIPS